MTNQESESLERARLLERVVSRWNNEGGAGVGGRAQPTSAETPPSPRRRAAVDDAEFEQLHIRVIALENLCAVLLAAASDRDLELARELAAYIGPRPGCTPHRLTVHASARMISLVEVASHVRALLVVSRKGSDDNPADAGPRV